MASLTLRYIRHLGRKSLPTRIIGKCISLSWHAKHIAFVDVNWIEICPIIVALGM